MKREEMLKEKSSLEWAIADLTLRLLRPFVQLTSGVARHIYLEEQIRKVTPKPQIVKEDEAVPLDLSGNDKKETAND